MPNDTMVGVNYTAKGPAGISSSKNSAADRGVAAVPGQIRHHSSTANFKGQSASRLTSSSSVSASVRASAGLATRTIARALSMAGLVLRGAWDVALHPSPTAAGVRVMVPVIA